MRGLLHYLTKMGKLLVSCYQVITSLHVNINLMATMSSYRSSSTSSATSLVCGPDSKRCVVTVDSALGLRVTSAAVESDICYRVRHHRKPKRQSTQRREPSERRDCDLHHVKPQKGEPQPLIFAYSPAFFGNARSLRLSSSQSTCRVALLHLLRRSARP